MENLVKEIPLSEVMATLELLGHLGVTRNTLTRLRVRPELTKQLVKSMLRGPMFHKFARDIMGKNFFGAEEWSYFYHELRSKQRLEVTDFPWGEDVLNSACLLCGKTVKDCHFAFLGLDRIGDKPLTILGWQKLCPTLGDLNFSSFSYYVPFKLISWYAKEQFATKIMTSLRWYLLHIVPVLKDTTYDQQKASLPAELRQDEQARAYDQQKARLPAEYEIPSAITEVTKNLLVFRETRNFMNLQQRAYCDDITSRGYHVDVGINENTLVIGDMGSINYGVGVAASRQLPSA